MRQSVFGIFVNVLDFCDVNFVFEEMKVDFWNFESIVEEFSWVSQNFERILEQFHGGFFEKNIKLIPESPKKPQAVATFEILIS